MNDARHDVLTTAEVAKVLRVSTKTIYRGLRSGTLPLRSIPGARGRYSREAVEALIAGRTKRAR